jgi:hypothetical protein
MKGHEDINKNNRGVKRFIFRYKKEDFSYLSGYPLLEYSEI